jgi:hypothetical protein
MRVIFLLAASLVSAQSFYAVGVSALPQSSPKPSGWACLAVLANTKAQLWSFSEMDYTAIRAPGPTGFTVQSSILSGLATPLRTFGPVTMYALGAGGAATTGSTSSGAVTGGTIFYIPLKNGNALVLGYEALKGVAGTQQIIKIGFGKQVKQ